MIINDAHCHFFSTPFFAALGGDTALKTLAWEAPGRTDELADRWVAELDRHHVARALAYASVTFIVPHFGAGFLREALMVADLCPNVRFDTSSSNAWIKYHSGLTLSAVFQQALAIVGADRLLFGTDSSFFPRGWVKDVYEQQSAALDELSI